jgi:hypothetical protein
MPGDGVLQDWPSEKGVHRFPPRDNEVELRVMPVALFGFGHCLVLIFSPGTGRKRGFNTAFGRHETNRSLGVGARKFSFSDPVEETV